MAFIAVFAYEVDADGAPAFEAVYGADGEWARYFRGGAGYLGTELWRGEEEDPLQYLVIDRWESAAAYGAFLAAHESEYGRRNVDAERLWRRETVVGRFEAHPGGS